MMTVRDIAFLSLLKCEKNHSYPNIEIDSMIEKYNLSSNDRAFYTVLVYGTIEKKITLDYIISQFSSRDIGKIDTEVLIILRMGVYQIMYMGGVPDHAACNESVLLCTKNNKKSASGFVNALLRELLRKKDSIIFPDKKQKPVEYLSVTYSYPEWLCQMWKDDYGFERCEAVLSSLNNTPDMTLRVNTEKTTVENVLQILSEKEIKAEKGLYAKNAVRLLQSYPVSQLEILKNGEVFVQDEASQLCAEVLGAKNGQTVIDTCSCPGGKSFSIALNMQNQGRVYSFDLHANKLSLVEKGAKRLGINIIQTKEHDGSKYLEELKGCADRVLVDAPCSGLGVIAKKPDLRYKEKSAIERLPEIQYRILNSSSEYVKTGGVLVYSTCTLNIRENENIVQKFFEEHTDFEPFDFDLGNKVKSQNGMITLYPDVYKTDGFFISRFVKK
ncbi:MAG: 16S rRNA (cytosine(967)-C(5))-methyltransferase RsmB [Ruminococcaceae bacterium]|nr:16S rRNA (cytosine(967)-C(5))-methyltransferase RsmB [Oscillospiraceae bacterium]